MAESTFPSPRRIVTSNKALEARFADDPNAEPAVRVTTEEITPEYLFDGKAARLPIFTHQTVPTNNNEPYINPQSLAASEIGETIAQGGALIQFSDLGPGCKIPMHRSTSTDYQFFYMGEVVMLNPDDGYDPKTGRGRVTETVCKAGDVVMQRGTLHAWENRTNEWVRFIAVGLGAQPGTVEVEGQDTQRVLKDCYDP